MGGGLPGRKGSKKRRIYKRKEKRESKLSSRIRQEEGGSSQERKARLRKTMVRESASSFWKNEDERDRITNKLRNGLDEDSLKYSYTAETKKKDESKAKEKKREAAKEKEREKGIESATTEELPGKVE